MAGKGRVGWSEGFIFFPLAAPSPSVSAQSEIDSMATFEGPVISTLTSHHTVYSVAVAASAYCEPLK